MYADEATSTAIREFLDKRLMGVLSTVNAAGNPESAAMYYFVDHADGLYLVMQKRSRKYANIIRNPHVSFTVFDERQSKTVQMEGTAVLIANGMREFDFAAKLLEHPRLEALYRDSHLVKGYFDQLTHEDLAVLRVSLAWVRFAMTDPRTHEMNYHQLRLREEGAAGQAAGS